MVHHQVQLASFHKVYPTIGSNYPEAVRSEAHPDRIVAHQLERWQFARRDARLPHWLFVHDDRVPAPRCPLRRQPTLDIVIKRIDTLGPVLDALLDVLTGEFVSTQLFYNCLRGHEHSFPVRFLPHRSV
jgi:hypothetical protein